MLVSTLCENRVGVINDLFYDSLPQFCDDCEYPMEMTEVFTNLHCSNPRCPVKVAQRLVAIANQIGVKDMGESRAKKFIDHFGLTNPLLIFAYEPDEDGQMANDIGMETSRKIYEQFNARRKFTLPEYVKMANLPNIQMSAFSLFEDYDDITEAFDAIEKGGVEYVRDKLNIKEKDTENLSVRAVKVYESLMTFKDDLIEGFEYIEVIKTHVEDMQMIKAVCSTEVGGNFRTKADFYAVCNNLYPNIHIEFGSSVTKKTDYLIWSGADGSNAAVTNKVKKARGYNEQGCDIKIVTALDFLGILECLAKGKN